MKKKILYSLLIFTLAILLPRDSVFAATGTCEPASALWSWEWVISIIFDVLLRLGSWIWVIIATLAGQLMTNEWVFASNVWLDETLWKLWNYMKNIANFLIAWLLVYQIAKGVIGKNALDIKKILPKVLISSVLVNMSWFILYAAVDVANLGVAAVGSVPQIFFQENQKNEGETRQLLASVPDTIKVQMECKKPIERYNAEKTTDKSYPIDKVWARVNDMSGPLVYMGLSIFRFQEYNLANESTASRKDLSIAGMVKLFVLIMFLAPIVALFIINLKRVLYLWVIIIFSPLLVVFDETIGMSKMPNIGGKVWWNNIKDLLSLKEVFGMIFAPIFTIAAMALALILSSSMFFVLGGNPGQTKAEQTRVETVLGWWTSITRTDKETTSFTAPWTDITFQGDIFDDVAHYAGWLVGYFILILFTIFLLRWVLGVSVSSSKIAKSTYDGVMNLGKNIVKWTNFIPIGWGQKGSIGSIMDAPNNLVSRYTSAANAKSWKLAEQFTDKFWRDTAVGKTLGKSIGKEVGTLSDLKEYEVPELERDLRGNLTFEQYIWKIKENLESKDGKITMSVGTAKNLQAMLEKYAWTDQWVSAINAFARWPSKVNVTWWVSQLDGFTKDKAKDIFNINNPIWKVFIATVSSLLTGDAVNPKSISENTTIFKKTAGAATDSSDSNWDDTGGAGT